MPKKSGKTNRNIGLDHINGKGDKSRVTNIIAYRENFAEINWGKRSPYRVVRRYTTLQPSLLTLREIEEAEHDWRMGL